MTLGTEKAEYIFMEIYPYKPQDLMGKCPAEVQTHWCIKASYLIQGLYLDLTTLANHSIYSGLCVSLFLLI